MQSDFVVCEQDILSLEILIAKVATYKISRLLLVSAAEQAGLSLNWSETPKTGFFRSEAHIMYSKTSMARTVMAHSPGLARTIIMVPTGHFIHNPSWMTETTLG